MDEGSDSDTLELALIENIQRHDLNPIEEANAFSRLLNQFELTQEEVASRVGKKRSTITNTLRLLTLPETIQQDVIAGSLSEGHARVLLRLKDNKEQMLTVRERIISEKLSVRETENACRQLKSKAEGKTKKVQMRRAGDELPASYTTSIINNLTNHLNTKVNIVQNGSRGKMEIEYYSSDDLDRLISLLTA
jgi:ParB family chromosome partitioning protein